MDGLSDAFSYAGDLAGWLYEHINGWALLIAIATPLLVIFVRQEVRIRRIRHIFDFERTFAQIGDSKDDRRVNPSFEFVRSKYLSDIETTGILSDTDHQLPTGAQLNELFVRVREQGRRQDLNMLIPSLALMILIYFGIEALFTAISCGFDGIACTCSRSFFATCAKAVPSKTVIADYGHLIIIGGLAFAGAYVETIRSLLRNLAVFDLSSYTFLRQSGEMIASVVFAVIAYAAIPDPLNPFAADGDREGVSRLWIALAPVLGLMPRSATQFVFTKTKNLIAWFKTEDDRFQNVTRVTTPDVIDGIDFATRFRLEICGIYDIQNLATANPIMLHIESPFGIFQCIDWVAQAQLCHVLGLEKFLLLRELNIRSIFDLERAIESEQGPDEIDIIYAGILFSTTQNLKAISATSGNRPLTVDADKVVPVMVDEYCAWARKMIGTDISHAKKCVEHVMRWIGDDLHVRRLRLVWNDISLSLGPNSVTLIDAKPKGATESTTQGGTTES